MSTVFIYVCTTFDEAIVVLCNILTTTIKTIQANKRDTICAHFGLTAQVQEISVVFAQILLSFDQATRVVFVDLTVVFDVLRYAYTRSANFVAFLRVFGSAL